MATVEAAIAPPAERTAAPRQGRGLLPLLPAGLLYVVVFAIPLALLLGLSLWRADGFDLVPALTIENYAEIAASPLHRAVLLRTVTVGLTTAAVIVPVAFALAFAMRFALERRGQLILQLLLLSLFSGYLVRIYAWRTILGKQGLINSTLIWSGLTDEPIAALIYSNLAVVVTLTSLLLPLAVLPIYSAMLNVPRETVEAARDLGAGRLHVIRTVLLPMVLPGVRTAFAFAFLLSAGDFVTPTLVGGTRSLLIGNVIADQFRGIGSNWPLGAALAFVTMACVLGIFLLLSRVLAWVTRW